MTTFMTDGKPRIPALIIGMMKGEAEASTPDEENNLGSLYGTNIPTKVKEIT